MTTGDPNVISADDIAGVNRTLINRAATLLRRAGVVLIVVSAVGLAAALYSIIRDQQTLEDRGYSRYGDTEMVDGPTFQDRVDEFAINSFIIVMPALALGVGFGMRMFADYAVVRTGGSLSGLVAGDPLPGNDTPDAPQIILEPQVIIEHPTP